jgi:predicted dehydrogenase
MTQSLARVAVIGCGGMARGHARKMLAQQDTTQIVVACEPSPEMYDAFAKVFTDAGLPAPPNQPDLARLLSDYKDQINTALIVTPHAYHFEQAKACLEAGLDVLLEKPMVITADEATRLIETRDRTGKLLVIAFNGSLSAQIRAASRLLRAGEFGDIMTITASVWEGWKDDKIGHWKKDPAISGGGFMFDTGAHMMNTVSDLAGQDFVEVAAWLENRGDTVDLDGVVMGRLASGTLVTLTACGSTIKSIGSDVKIFCAKGIIRTGVWGEFLEFQRLGESKLTPVELPAVPGVWEQFLAVRSGQIDNPSPPEIGLRMAKLWDAIQLSSRQGGALVKL